MNIKYVIVHKPTGRVVNRGSVGRNVEPGITQHDLMTAIEDWAESKKATNRIDEWQLIPEDAPEYKQYQ